MTTLTLDQNQVANGLMETLQEKVTAHYANKPLMLSQSELIELWDTGLLNEAAYILLALKLEASADTTFDVDEFCKRWEGVANEKGKAKHPQRKTVMSVVEKLEKLGLATIQRTTLQMELSL